MEIIYVISAFLFSLLPYLVAGIAIYVLKQGFEQLSAALVTQTPSPAAPAPGEEEATAQALRLQAYERFTLMLERIAVPSLLLRQPPPEDISARAYTANLLLTIRDEVEYNVTQQIYVSDSLWNIIQQARDNVSQLIVRAAEGAEGGAQVANRLRLMSGQQPADAIQLAQAAIRREASGLLAG